MTLVVSNYVVTVWIFLVELFVCSLLDTLLAPLDYVVRVEHSLMLTFLIKPELFLTRRISKLCAQLNNSLSEPL